MKKKKKVESDSERAWAKATHFKKGCHDREYELKKIEEEKEQNRKTGSAGEKDNELKQQTSR
jgi:hypothetical protein